MIRYHATWILPISEPPIRDGWVAVDRGRIVAYGALGPAGRRGLADGAREIDLGHVAVLPGLVNAHTHLELSYLRDEVPRMLELATARADGDQSVPEELRFYPARSRAAKQERRHGTSEDGTAAGLRDAE